MAARRRDGFMRLAERHHPRLLHYVRRLVRDRGTADDVLQETWVAAYRGLRRLREPERLRPWLYGIARNQALNALRREERARLELVDDEVLEAIPDADGDVFMPPAAEPTPRRDRGRAANDRRSRSNAFMTQTGRREVSGGR